MIYLYVKTHNKTGLKYLGKTKSKDPELYQGSGKYWRRHIEKHGYDVTTQILLVTSDEKELKETGIFFSKLFRVVESQEWANLKLESGDGGWDHMIGKEKIVSDETRKRMSKSATIRQTGFTNSFYGKNHTSETKEKIGKSSKERANSQYSFRIKEGNHPNNFVDCPHCDKHGQSRAMKRWHFDKCKFKETPNL